MVLAVKKSIKSQIQGYYKMNDQICVINQEVLEKKLFFQKAYQVSQNEK